MYTIKVRSSAREELVEFTDQVQAKLRESDAREGVVVLYVQHTTAGLTVNENADPDVPRDMLHALRTLIPQHGMGFRHGEENSDAHIKASLVGSSVSVPFKDGKPAGKPEDFLTGFVEDLAKSKVHGRPVGMSVLADGSMLVSDDSSNTIWRVSHK